MDVEPTREYISPYSSRRFQRVTWQDVTPGWLGIYRAVEWADPSVLDYLKEFKFATRSQLLRNFYESHENGKKRIERMARTGILLRHSLESRAGDTALYSLGPLGAELVHERWLPNWWRPISLVDVLKRLVTSDLCLGVASIWPCDYVEAEWPLTAYLTFGGMEYGILVLRDDVELLRRKITKATAVRLIVVVERIGDAARLNTVLDIPARFITDQELVTKPFAESVMFRFEDGVLIADNISDDIIAGNASAAV